MKLFLEGNLQSRASNTLTQFYSEFDRAFLKALRLSSQISLGGPRYVWNWHSANIAFDGHVMEVDGPPLRDTLGNVQACLFPTLMERAEAQSSHDDAEEYVVFPAIVALQR